MADINYMIIKYIYKYIVTKNFNYLKYICLRHSITLCITRKRLLKLN